MAAIEGFGSISFGGVEVSPRLSNDDMEIKGEELEESWGEVNLTMDADLPPLNGDTFYFPEVNEVTVCLYSDLQKKRNKRQARRNKKRANGTRRRKSQRKVIKSMKDVIGVLGEIKKDGACTINITGKV
jgi:hypothetical protein